MKVFNPETGQEYNGDPVDCRELRQVGGYLDQPPTDEQKAAAKEAREKRESDQFPAAAAADAGKSRSAKIDGEAKGKEDPGTKPIEGKPAEPANSGTKPSETTKETKK